MDITGLNHRGDNRVRFKEMTEKAKEYIAHKLKDIDTTLKVLREQLDKIWDTVENDRQDNREADKR